MCTFINVFTRVENTHVLVTTGDGHILTRIAELVEADSFFKTSTYTLKQSSLLTELSDVSTVVVSEHLITEYCISNLHTFNTAQRVFRTSLMSHSSSMCQHHLMKTSAIIIWQDTILLLFVRNFLPASISQAYCSVTFNHHLMSHF